MNKLYYLIFSLPLYAFGASSGSGEYDIIPRTINFLIFIAILYYFAATPFKNFYKNRILKISFKLDEIQKKLLESKAKKLETMKKLEEAKANSAAALVIAKKEAEILVENIKKETQDELNLLQKHFEEQKDYELRKMEKELVSDILNEIFIDPKMTLKQNEILDLMMKKVS
ncbi:F0F1 ATP synthase subunit B [Campylobacter hepaticus]|uniref:ATP synthase subunit b n=1 Tax=Campylobacter hepaticus TaxID=1813019 RepID=A0A424Z155_9BACT|nr:F0F1 ATP synthase subunit B [Campylobacter hepaticus]AXP09158.1 F0F1 ATP synthase subunit B [Campylobacter hepaticus]MCZ0771653.1 F0F1 ATP synthase subunit B [Campylobacter hepaticus]MCZ0773121.1 F0F1 ATP synthase subunit B [Campylobacter hepaticus]MCZ0775801.1 F0F1 ATP synthase subunit B [Campylobacter hepaticus]MDX2323420.1 F0F1 ATP synthase subunit B [Campylobacter hepaticus]